jgi:hypothetical protein
MGIIREVEICTGRAVGRTVAASGGGCLPSFGRLDLALLIGLAAPPVIADQPVFPEGFMELDREVQALKLELLEINHELLKLEEELLYPPDKQLVVFLSLDKGMPLAVQRLRIELDGKAIVDQVYTRPQADALHKGGVHRPYTGKLRYGKHRLQAFISGIRSDGAAFRQTSTHLFYKGQGARYIELRVAGTGTGGQAELTIHEWQR